MGGCSSLSLSLFILKMGGEGMECWAPIQRACAL